MILNEKKKDDSEGKVLPGCFMMGLEVHMVSRMPWCAWSTGRETGLVRLNALRQSCEEAAASSLLVYKDQLCVWVCEKKFPFFFLFSFPCPWLTSRVVAWSGQLLQGTGSRSWACLVRGAASASLRKTIAAKTVVLVQTIQKIFFLSVILWQILGELDWRFKIWTKLNF